MMWTPDRFSPAPRDPTKTGLTTDQGGRQEAAVGLRQGRLAALERRYLTRLLGHPPKRADAARLPGVNLSDV